MDEEQQMQENDSLSFCPSFNSYTSHRFAEIASEVGENLGEGPHVETSNEPADDDGFEFAIARSDLDGTGDEIFYDGQIRPIFPIFDRNLLTREDQDHDQTESDVPAIRIPLSKLFVEDREPSSVSSSEADELESVPPGTYCVWRPKVVEASPSRCKKSNSTGSASKRWRFSNLLRRSNSEGKDSFVFMTPKSREQKGDKFDTNVKERGDAVKVTAKVKAKGVAGGEKATPSSSAHEEFYVRNRAMKEDYKKKSFLPYRKDLVGFFANVNGLSRNFPPF
ncbi:uncharacterized protein LOC132285207 [Cornus florida]|uniref:uncharacterized protein LOC132285207 n=1 Tax=Cornus florida TaxID=4283 RepID=UPI0028A12827|nr:uncharacterized protein LOC132285207 [Cornus florida]